MARIRNTKDGQKPSENLMKAKKAFLRKVTWMKLMQTAQALALVAIALKLFGLV